MTHVGPQRQKKNNNNTFYNDIRQVAAPGLEDRRLTAVGTRCADHVTPLYPQKLALTSPTGGGRSVGIVRSRTKATEFSFSLYVNQLHKYIASPVFYIFRILKFVNTIMLITVIRKCYTNNAP